jgi:hypothetical protein
MSNMMAQQHLAAIVYVRDCMAIAEVVWRSCCKEAVKQRVL